MIAKICSAIPYGFEGKIIEVEGDANKGLPAFNIVGMANRTISEAKERVRSAITNSGLNFPRKKLTISLAPAELLKDGSYLDLPIALSVLALAGQITEANVQRRLFVGELSLDGRVRAVRGIINVIEAAKEAGCQEVFAPEANLAQAALVEGVKIYGVASLKGLYLALKGQQKLPEATERRVKAVRVKNDAEGAIRANERVSRGEGAGEGGVNDWSEIRGENAVLLDHIRGQELAKRALAVAVAGHHNILISGPPGAGKTMLAKAAANLLPEPTPGERVEITKLHSLVSASREEVAQRRPFRNPHHSASMSAVLGGGPLAEPGEVSLAHKGILFLDELPEFSRAVLEALRQPLEDKEIKVSRANRKSSYPADFMLVATMNPCPCGYLGDATHECTCSEAQIQNYRRKLSGPLFDRIDIHIEVDRVKNEALTGVVTINEGEHIAVKNTITEAIERQKRRFGRDGVFNSSLSSFQVSKMLKLEKAAEKLLAEAARAVDLSARAYFKTIKVARTVADLAGAEMIRVEDVTEALTYRQR